MLIAAVVLSVLLALVMLGSGIAKLLHAPNVVTQMAAVGVTRSQTTVLGVVDLAAALGLLVGLLDRPLAIAAAIGVVLYFVAAITAHLRAKDRNMQGAIAFLVLGVATLTMLLLSA